MASESLLSCIQPLLRHLRKQLPCISRRCHSRSYIWLQSKAYVLVYTSHLLSCISTFFVAFKKSIWISLRFVKCSSAKEWWQWNQVPQYVVDAASKTDFIGAIDNCLRTVEITTGYTNVGVDLLKSRHWRLLKVFHRNRLCGSSCCTFWNTFTLSGVAMSTLAL